MKKFVKFGVAILAVTGLTSALAATPGTYVGAGLGYTQLNTPSTYPNVASTNKQSTTQNHVGGRVFAGYNFNENFGLEAGYNYYSPAKYTAKTTSGSTTASVQNEMQTLDLVGKAYLPVGNGFDLYGLGGVAYVNSKVDNSGTTPVFASSPTTNKFRPKFGVGASYNIPNSQVTTSLELTRVQGTGNTKTDNTAIPSANAAMLSVSYNIG